VLQKKMSSEGEGAEYTFPEPTPIFPPAFRCDDPAALDYLNQNGYVRFSGVASPEEIDTAISLFWDHAESVDLRFRRNEPLTWHRGWIGYPPNGLIGGRGISQSAFMWYCRTLPSVIAAFQTIWPNTNNDTEDNNNNNNNKNQKKQPLLVSFDGAGAFRPPEVNPDWLTLGGWYHVDQNGYNKHGRHSVQGLLNMYESGPQDGGLVVWPRSHSQFDAIFAKYTDLCSKNARDFVRFFSKHHMWKEELSDPSFFPIKICLNAGDFVMWDSRTIHCNQPASIVSDLTKTPIKRLRRLVAYICMTPCRMVTDPKVLEYRVIASRNGLGTTHWPHEFNEKYLLQDPPSNFRPIKFTDIHKSLIAGDPKEFSMIEKRVVKREMMEWLKKYSKWLCLPISILFVFVAIFASFFS